MTKVCNRRGPAVVMVIILLTAGGCGKRADEPVGGPAAADGTTVSGERMVEHASDSSSPQAEALRSFARDDAAYLTRIGLIRGHLQVGIELYRLGRHDHAKRHMKHPADELYAALTGAFAERRSAGFADELDALATLVEEDADDKVVERAYTALLERIAAAESHVDAATALNTGVQLSIVVNLLEEAADEYSIGIVEGRIENVHEYQDAYGFTQIAGDRADTARSNTDDAGTRARWSQVVANIEDLSSLWPTLVPTGRVDGSAERIEAAVDSTAHSLVDSYSRTKQ